MTRIRSNRFRSRRKRSHMNRLQTAVLSRGFVLSLAVLVPVLTFAAWTVFGKDRRETKQPSASAAYAPDAPMEASSLPAAPAVTVQGVDLTGLDRSAAEKKLTEAFSWDVSVVWENDRLPFPNPLEPEIGRILDEIYAAGQSSSENYTFDLEAVEERILEAADEFAGRFDRSPENSQLVSYDRETGKYQYSKEVSGLRLDRDQLAADVLAAVNSGSYTASISPSLTIIPPERTQAQAKEQYQVIGTFTTKTTNNKNRNQNIQLAVDAIDGRILKAGEEFSFNLATGNRTSEKGYQPAGAYKNGVLIEEPGGGVCQVSTTLYHAIITSGFMTTERNSHSFAPSYVEPGQDAMVSFDGYAGPDLKFVNTNTTSIALRANFQDNLLKLSIVGLPVLEDGVKVSIRSEQVGETPAPDQVLEENPNLPYGTQQQVEAPKPGASWKSFRVVTKNGEVIQETPLHNSNYRPKAGVIQQNTTVPGETAAPTAPAAPAETPAETPVAPQAGTQVETQDGTQVEAQGGAQGEAPDSAQGEPTVGAPDELPNDLQSALPTVTPAQTQSGPLSTTPTNP